MKFSNKYMEYIAYGSIIFLLFIIISSTFKHQENILRDLSFRKNTNLQSNIDGYQNIKINKKQPTNNEKNTKTNNNIEGFSNNQFTEINSNELFNNIDQQISNLMQDIGGQEGKNKLKQNLTATKKVCDLESAKSIISMLGNTNTEEINLYNIDHLLNNNYGSENIRYKKYTELSKTIQNIIDGI